MSTSKTVYIGPYLRIEERVTVTQEDLCAGHDRSEGTRHCPECGRGHRGRYVEWRDKPSDAFFEEHEDVFQRITAENLETRDTGETSVHYAIANGRPLPPHLYLSRDDCGAWGNGAAALCDPAAAVLIFAEQRRPAIEELRALGATVTVEWGVLAWVW